MRLGYDVLCLIIPHPEEDVSPSRRMQAGATYRQADPLRPKTT